MRMIVGKKKGFNKKLLIIPLIIMLTVTAVFAYPYLSEIFSVDQHIKSSYNLHYISNITLPEVFDFVAYDYTVGNVSDPPLIIWKLNPDNIVYAHFSPINSANYNETYEYFNFTALNYYTGVPSTTPPLVGTTANFCIDETSVVELLHDYWTSPNKDGYNKICYNIKFRARGIPQATYTDFNGAILVEAIDV